MYSPIAQKCILSSSHFTPTRCVRFIHMAIHFTAPPSYLPLRLTSQLEVPKRTERDRVHQRSRRSQSYGTLIVPNNAAGTAQLPEIKTLPARTRRVLRVQAERRSRSPITDIVRLLEYKFLVLGACRLRSTSWNQMRIHEALNGLLTKTQFRR